MNVKMKRLTVIICGIIMICTNSAKMTTCAKEYTDTVMVSAYQELRGDNIGQGIYDIPQMTGIKAATLTGCTIGISVDANGVKGSINTGSTVMASKIGVEDIRVEKYVNGKWTLVGTNSGGYATNDDLYGINISTSSAQKGVQYRISCVHYANLNGVRHELFNVTNGVSY